MQNEIKPITHVMLTLTNQCPLRCKYCLPSGTKIQMGDFSSKNIEDIQIGDVVLSSQEHAFSFADRTIFPNHVTQLFHKKDTLVKIELSNGGEIEATLNHPILTGENNWVKFGDLHIGDEVVWLGEQKHLMRVWVCNITHLPDEVDVYNFATEAHTYFANRILVHNCFEAHDVQRMSYETALQCAKFLGANAESIGVEPRIAFFGGEPLLEYDTVIKPLVTWIREEYKKPFGLSISSNCILMDEDKLQFFKKNRVSIMLSIDGNKSTQDRNRPLKGGASSFDILEEKIPLITRYFPYVTMRMTLDEPSAHEFMDGVLFLEQSKCRIFTLLPNFFYTWSDAGKKEMANQVKLYGDYIVDRYRTGKEPLMFPEYASCFYKIMLHNQMECSGEYRTLRNNTAYGRCGLASNGHASTDTYGNLYTCHHVSPMEVGSKLYIGDVWSGVDNNKVQSLIDEFETVELHGTNCDTCKLNRFCTGGCVPNNYAINGDFASVPEMYCYWYQLLFDNAVEVMNILSKEENEMFRTKFEQCVLYKRFAG